MSEAIQVVVKQELKENHDDTLVEKLLSHIKSLVLTLDLEDKQVTKLLGLLNQFMDEEDTREQQQSNAQEDSNGDSRHVDSMDTQDKTPMKPMLQPVAIKLLCILLTRFSAHLDDGLFEDPVVEEAFSSFLLTVSLVTVESDSSLQASVIYCLKILKKQEFLTTTTLTSCKMTWKSSANSNTNTKCTNILQVLYMLMLKSPSYFVRHDSESLLMDICTSNVSLVCYWNASTSFHYNKFLPSLIRDIILVPSRENLRFLKSLLSCQTTRRIFSRTGTRDVIAKQLEEMMALSSNQSFDNKLFYDMLDVLGTLNTTNEVVETVTTFCLKRNDLKGLIIFTSRLLSIDREQLSKWLLYSLYTVVARTERRIEVSQQMMASIREKAFVERHADYNELLCALSHIEEAFPNLDDKGVMVIESLQILIQSKILIGSRSQKPHQDAKVVTAALSALWKAFAVDLIPEEDFNDMLCDLILEAAKVSSPEAQPSVYLEEVLSMAQILWSSRVGITYQSTLVDRVLPTFARILRCKKFSVPIHQINSNGHSGENMMQIEHQENEWRVKCIEAMMESLKPLTSSVKFGNHDDFTMAFKDIWTQYREEKWFISCVIPILFTMDFEVSGEKLEKIFGWTRHKEIPVMLSKFLADPVLSDKVVEVFSIQNNMTRLQQMAEYHTDVFQDLVSNVCLTSLNTVDVELQTDIFNLFQEFVKPSSTSDLRLLYSSGLLTTVMIVHESDLYSSFTQIRLTTFEISEVIRHFICINLGMDSRDLRKELEKVSPPTIFNNKSLENKELNNKESNCPASTDQDRVQVIETMFKGFVRQATVDLIDELNSRPGVNGEESQIHLPWTDFSLDDLCDYYTKKGVYIQAESFSTGVVEDILAAKETANAASIDCY